MSSPNDGIKVDVAALTAYARQLGYYETEADKFGGAIDQADVTNEAWGLIGVWAKKSYTDRLTELRSLLDEMKQGVDTLTSKISESAAIYQGAEDDKVITFGQHEATIDGPR
ncbi:WXG100 family type VII secretion target [Actinocrispum wychmicini]|uniref:Excreted virulence factor EspC (Type VII ESX diderm) n=1 Tax=Actinocrispum wychmicini TaxID=1213861 RepID=A0A4R2JZS5_9PSEU|nr:hypothetical protein [Actinocrispum wychmicini]TCO62936.1 hypothetical protein EV192_1021076 [Actinocrispum wychmicini]